MSTLMPRDHFDPEELGVASEAFSISWDFIDRDPAFGSCDRQKLQADLARAIFQMMELGESNFLYIANRSIRQLRDKYERPTRSTVRAPGVPTGQAGKPLPLRDHRVEHLMAGTKV